jgi:hypothetical protein
MHLRSGPCYGCSAVRSGKQLQELLPAYWTQRTCSISSEQAVDVQQTMHAWSSTHTRVTCTKLFKKALLLACIPTKVFHSVCSNECLRARQLTVQFPSTWSSGTASEWFSEGCCKCLHDKSRGQLELLACMCPLPTPDFIHTRRHNHPPALNRKPARQPNPQQPPNQQQRKHPQQRRLQQQKLTHG